MSNFRVALLAGLTLTLTLSVEQSRANNRPIEEIVVTAQKIKTNGFSTLSFVTSQRIEAEAYAYQVSALTARLALARALLAVALKKAADKVLAKKAADRLSRHVKAQLKKRGWSDKEIENLLKKPDRTSLGKSNHSGEETFVYWKNNRDYIVVDPKTSRIIQVSDKTNPRWMPHPSIEYPYPGTYANPLPVGGGGVVSAPPNISIDLPSVNLIVQHETSGGGSGGGGYNGGGSRYLP